MIRIFSLVSLSLLTACTELVPVPSDSYAILLRFGEIKKAVSGPAQIDVAPFIDHLRLIDKEHVIVLNDGQYSIRYLVVDPSKYYMLLGGNRSILPFLERELARESLKGKAIKSQDDLYELIEKMKLPIKILKNA